MSYTQKRITLEITLGTGAFGESGQNVVTLEGLRASVTVLVAGADSMGTCQIRVFGLPLAMINQLTTVGPIAAAIRAKNSVVISAGDDVTGVKTVFQGSIDQAWGEFQSLPEVPLNIIGFAGLINALRPVVPLSFPGSADVATIMSGLAETMGLTFENNGVTVQLSNPYFPGTAYAQVQACARAADIKFCIDRGVLAIWPKSGARGGDVPEISLDTDMIGYPTFSSNGLQVTTLFNPTIKPGGLVQVKSSLPVACGTWYVFGVSHSLEAETPDGQWFTSIACYPKNDQ